MIKQILLLCLTLSLSPVMSIKPQPQSPLYHNNLLTKEKLLYRGDIEDLWAAIEELRAAAYPTDRYLYKFNTYKTSSCSQMFWAWSNSVYEVDYTHDGKYVGFTNLNPNMGSDKTDMAITTINNGLIQSNNIIENNGNNIIQEYTLGGVGAIWEFYWSPFIDINKYYFTIVDNDSTLKLYRFQSPSITHLASLSKSSTVLTNSIKKIAWSPEGAHIALAGKSNDGLLKLQIFSCTPESAPQFNALTSLDISSTTTHTSVITGMSWNNNNILAISYYENDTNTTVIEKLKIIEFNNTTLSITTTINVNITHNNDRTNKIFWSPNSEYLALILENEKIAIYSYNHATHTLSLATTMNKKFWKITSLTWSPDSRYIAAGHLTQEQYAVTILNFDNNRNINYKLLEEKKILIEQGGARLVWSKPYQNYSLITQASSSGASAWMGAPAIAIPTTYASLYEHWDNYNIITENKIATHDDIVNELDIKQQEIEQKLWGYYLFSSFYRKEMSAIEGISSYIQNIKFSNDGKFLLSSEGGRFCLHSLNSENTLDVIPHTIYENNYINNAQWLETDQYYIMNSKTEYNYYDYSSTHKKEIWSFNPEAISESKLQLLETITIEPPAGYPIDSGMMGGMNSYSFGLGDATVANDYNLIIQNCSMDNMYTPTNKFWITKLYKFDKTTTPTIQFLTEYQSPAGEATPTKIEYKNNYIIGKVNHDSQNLMKISILKFNPENTTITHVSTLELPHGLYVLHPNGKYLVAIGDGEWIDNNENPYYNAWATSKKIYIYAFNDNYTSLTLLHTEEDPQFYNFLQCAWDHSGKILMAIHQNSAFIYEFNPAEETMLKFVDSVDIQGGGIAMYGSGIVGNPGSDIIAWSNPYNDITNLVINRVFIYPMTWAIPIVPKTFNDNLAERAIEVSKGSALFDFKISTTFDGDNKTYVLSGADQQLIKVALNQNVAFKNIILQNFNFNTINLQANASLFFDDQTTLALDGSQYEINRTYTFRGNCIINGNNSTVVFGPDAGFFVDSNATLLLQNVTIKGLSNEQLRCMDCTSTVSFGGSVNLFMDGNYYFKQGKFALLPASQVNVNNEYNFYYQSPCPSIIGSAAVFQMTRNAKFYYEPQNDNHDLIQFANDDSIFCLKGATLVSSTTGMRLTKGTFKTNGEKNYIYSSGRTLSDSIMLGNGIFEDNLFCQFEGSNVGIVNGKVIWANVEEPTP